MGHGAPPFFWDVPGEPPEPWHSWIQLFHQFLSQITTSDDVKIALLSTYLGKEGQRILNSLLSIKGKKQTTYSEIVKLLHTHYGHNRPTYQLPEVESWIPKPSSPDNKAWKIAGIAGAAVVGGVGAVAAAPVALAAAGFTSAGIAAGSVAASMMSSAAIANGGGIAVGSLVAVLQSAGAAALPFSCATAVGSVGAGVGGAFGWIASKFGKN